MVRAYNVAIAALTVGVSVKWVDNLLSHHHLPGIIQGRQGVQRLISEEGLLAIEVSRMLAEDLGLSLSRAAELAKGVLGSRSESTTTIRLADGVELSMDLNAFERRLREKVVAAVDSVAHVSRGRPARA